MLLNYLLLKLRVLSIKLSVLILVNVCILALVVLDCILIIVLNVHLPLIVVVGKLLHNLLFALLERLGLLGDLLSDALGSRHISVLDWRLPTSRGGPSG